MESGPSQDYFPENITPVLKQINMKKERRKEFATIEIKYQSIYFENSEDTAPLGLTPENFSEALVWG